MPQSPEPLRPEPPSLEDLPIPDEIASRSSDDVVELLVRVPIESIEGEEVGDSEFDAEAAAGVNDDLAADRAPAGAQRGSETADGILGLVIGAEAEIEREALAASRRPSRAGSHSVVNRDDHVRFARLHLRTGSLLQARSEYEALAACDLLDVPATLDLAEVRWRTGDLVGAGMAAAIYLAADGEDVLGFLIAAEAAAAEDRLVEARRHAGRALERSVSNLERFFAGVPRRMSWPESSWMAPVPIDKAPALVLPATPVASVAAEAPAEAPEGSLWAQPEETAVAPEVEAAAVAEPEVAPEIEAVAVEAVEAPEIEAPEIEAPEIEAVEAPEIEAPEIEAPEIEAVEAPEIEAVEAPEIEAPEIEAPEIEAVAVEAVEAPEIEAPEIEAVAVEAVEAPAAVALVPVEVETEAVAIEPAPEPPVEQVETSEAPAASIAQEPAPTLVPELAPTPAPEAARTLAPEPEPAPEPLAAAAANPWDDEIRAGVETLESGDALMAALHFALALRISPASARAVMDAIGARSDPALELVRGDAVRLLGAESTGVRANASVASRLGRNKPAVAPEPTAPEPAPEPTAPEPAPEATAPEAVAPEPSAPEPASEPAGQAKADEPPPSIRWE